jgi:16S rRNA (guanine966-N2)-methyltransferase
VKEALFSILGPLRGATVADLFAGTGALGIEALSRGASRVAFVETAPAALQILRDNLRDVGATAEEVVVVPARAERALQRLVAIGPFDLLLFDPPYRDVDLAVRVMDDLAGVASAGARAVIEHAERDTPAASTGWVLEERRRYGDTALSIFALSA